MSDKIEGAEISQFWLDTLGVAVGDEILILPVGAQGGQGFQGFLVNVVISGQTLSPYAIVIQQAEGMPHVTIPWHAIQMVAKPTVSAAAQQAAADAANESVSLANLIKFSEENGIDVPDEVRQAAIDEG